MALLFFDGFETIKSNSELAELYVVTGAPSVIGGRGRSAVALLGPDDANYLTKTLAASVTTIIIGCAIKLVAQTNFVPYIIQLLDSAGAVQGGLRVNSDASVSYCRGSPLSPTALITSAASAFSLTDWNYIELKVLISDTVGTAEIKIDGSSVASASSLDTANTANINAQGITLGTGLNHTGSCQFYYDDWYVCDTSGSYNNDFLGAVRVDPLFIDGEATHDDFTASSGTNGALMINTLEESLSVGYIESNTSGHKATFSVQAPVEISGAGTIFGLMLEARAADSGTARSLAGMVRSSTTESTGTAVALGASNASAVQVVGLDPATSALWTSSALNAAEIGVTVTA